VSIPIRVACTLGRRNRKVNLLLRSHPFGTLLRCVYEGRVLWTKVLPCGPAQAQAQWAIDDSRAAWEAEGWRCECSGVGAAGLTTGDSAR
jgi:hypothetical protein